MISDARITGTAKGRYGRGDATPPPGAAGALTVRPG